MIQCLVAVKDLLKYRAHTKLRRIFVHEFTLMLYRIKYLLGILVGLFSLVYLLFGIVGWVNGDVTHADLVTCFLLASVHIGAGTWLLFTSLSQYRIERRQLDTATQYLIRQQNGRIAPADLARLVEISEEDANEYLEQRSKYDVAVKMSSRTGNEVFFFGQQYWNN